MSRIITHTETLNDLGRLTRNSGALVDGNQRGLGGLDAHETITLVRNGQSADSRGISVHTTQVASGSGTYTKLSVNRAVIGPEAEVFLASGVEARGLDT